MAAKGNTRAGAKTSVSYLQLNEDLKKGSYSPLYLLYGEEQYLKRFYKKRFREAVGGEDSMNCQVLEGSSDIESIIDYLDTLPFFADNRLLILEDSRYFKNAAPEKLLKYLPDMPKTSHLMLLENEVDKRSKMYKYCQKAGIVCELGFQDEKTLSDWAAQYLKRAGKKIRPSTMRIFLNKTGSSMDRISGELEKLIAYVGKREVIENPDVEKVCFENVEDRVFDMISAHALGETDQAIRLYKDLLSLQEPPMKILALLRRHYRQLLLVKEATVNLPRQNQNNQNMISEYAGLVSWTVPRLLRQAQRYSITELEVIMGRLLHYDYDIKAGKLQDRMAVELFLIER